MIEWYQFEGEEKFSITKSINVLKRVTKFVALFFYT